MTWHGTSRQSRGYGARWDKLRLTILRRDMHLCQPCDRAGRVTPGHTIDHIKPKAEGGTDEPGNLEVICTPCHAEKTAEEAARAQRALRDEGKAHTGADGWRVEPKRWGYSIPDGVRHAAIPLTIVAGPPASGKSTHVEQHATRSDFIIDLDRIMVRLGGVQWDSDPGIIKRSLRYRDMMIRSLAEKTAGAAWLAIAAPTRDERATWLEALGPKAQMVVIDTPLDVCRERIEADPRRKASAVKQLQVVARWEPEP